METLGKDIYKKIALTMGKSYDVITYTLTLIGEKKSIVIFSEVYNPKKDLIGELVDNAHNELEMVKCLLIEEDLNLTDKAIDTLLDSIKMNKATEIEITHF